MSQTTPYDPKKVTLLLNGIPIEGYADGTAIMFRATTARVSSRVGINGDIEVIKSNDNRGEFEITLMGISPSNDLLSGLDQFNTLKDLVIGAATLKDGNGGTLIHSSNALVEGVPEVAYGKDSGDRKWKILLLPYDNAVVAGAGPGGLVAAALGAIGGALGL